MKYLRTLTAPGPKQGFSACPTGEFVFAAMARGDF